MTQRAYPLNDTLYTAEDVRLFHAARTSGIFNAKGNDLMVQATTGMIVNVLPGVAFLLTGTNAMGGITYASDTTESFTVETARGTDRYDYISVMYSKTTNTCVLKYSKGSETKPSGPIRNANEYEIILAIIKVRANAPDIKGSDIIDCRLNSTYCGLVTDGTERVPTDGMDQEFRVYMDEIKNVLNKDTAGNLMNQIKAIPMVYKGTSSTPPSEWKDGDIYVMYE